VAVTPVHHRIDDLHQESATLAVLRPAGAGDTAFIMPWSTDSPSILSRKDNAQGRPLHPPGLAPRSFHKGLRPSRRRPAARRTPPARFACLLIGVRDSNPRYWYRGRIANRRTVMSRTSPPSESGRTPEVHDTWFRNRVKEALADTRPAVSHKQAMREAQALIDKKRCRS